MKKTAPRPRRRPLPVLLRVRRAAAGDPRRRRAGARAGPDRTALERAARRAGHRLDGAPGADVPAAGRVLPALPDGRRRRVRDGDARRRLRARRLREPLPQLPPGRAGRRGRVARWTARTRAAGVCEVVAVLAASTRRRSRRCRSAQVRHLVDVWCDRYGELARAAGGGVRVHLREPRQGDRRHADAPARPDLRLSVRPAAGAAGAGGGVRCIMQRPARCLHVRYRRGGDRVRRARRGERARVRGVRAVRRARCRTRSMSPRRRIASRCSTSAESSAMASRGSCGACRRRTTASGASRCRTRCRCTSAPRTASQRAGDHLHIEFMPPYRTKDKLKYLAGVETGAGTYINDTAPEEKAAELRARSAHEHDVDERRTSHRPPCRTSSASRRWSPRFETRVRPRVPKASPKRPGG